MLLPSVAVATLALSRPVVPPRAHACLRERVFERELEKDSKRELKREFDVVVIGSGIGGLSAAALLAHNGKSVCVCEAHDAPGGAAHEWCVNGFHFESGPSLYAGLSPRRTPNPLAHVFHIIGEEPEWITYDRWGTYLPEGNFAAAVGAEDFARKLDLYGGPDARQQWTRLMSRVEPLGTAIFDLPSAAVRMDGWAALTLGVRFAPALLRVLLAGGSRLEAPFSRILEEERVTDPFILNWLDMICFLLQGATVKDAPTTLMAYMLSDFYRSGVKLDFPRGGTASIVQALVRGVNKQPDSEVRLRANVKSLVVEGGRAVGVELEGGSVVRARQAVVSNADLWSNLKLVKASFPSTRGEGCDDSEAVQTADGKLAELAAELEERVRSVGRCGSFLHLHVGIDGYGLPTEPSEAFPAQWAVVSDWEVGVDSPRNTVLVSMASMLDPSLAPEGRQASTRTACCLAHRNRLHCPQVACPEAPSLVYSLEP